MNQHLRRDRSSGQRSPDRQLWRGALELITVQRPGGKPVNGAQYAQARLSRRENAWWRPIEQFKHSGAPKRRSPMRDSLRSNIVQAVLEGARLERAIAKFGAQSFDGRDRASSVSSPAAPCAGTSCSTRGSNRCSRNRSRPNARGVTFAGLYQIAFTPFPPRSCVHQRGVGKALKLGRASGLVNGVCAVSSQRDAIVQAKLPEATQAACPIGSQPS